MGNSGSVIFFLNWLAEHSAALVDVLNALAHVLAFAVAGLALYLLLRAAPRRSKGRLRSPIPCYMQGEQKPANQAGGMGSRGRKSLGRG